MIRTIFLLAILGISPSVKAQFRDLQWGAHRDAIIKTEQIDCDRSGLWKPFCNEDRICIYPMIAGAYATSCFLLADDKLTEGFYNFSDSPLGQRGSFGDQQVKENVQHLHSTFQKLHQLLTEKYGSPNTDFRADEFHKEDWVDGLGHYGRLGYTEWVTTTSVIGLEMDRSGYIMGPDDEEHDYVELQLTYRSVELGDWGEEWRNEFRELQKQRWAEEKKQKRLKGL